MRKRQLDVTATTAEGLDALGRRHQLHVFETTMTPQLLTLLCTVNAPLLVRTTIAALRLRRHAKDVIIDAQ